MAILGVWDQNIGNSSSPCGIECFVASGFEFGGASASESFVFQFWQRGSATKLSRGPKDHTNIRILRPKTRRIPENHGLQDPSVYVSYNQYSGY